MSTVQFFNRNLQICFNFSKIRKRLFYAARVHAPGVLKYAANHKQISFCKWNIFSSYNSLKFNSMATTAQHISCMP